MLQLGGTVLGPEASLVQRAAFNPTDIGVIGLFGEVFASVRPVTVHATPVLIANLVATTLALFQRWVGATASLSMAIRGSPWRLDASGKLTLSFLSAIRGFLTGGAKTKARSLMHVLY